ncbi:hypothetical protein LY78DRAFT_22674 [Colletotrichum sublineola]|nr:hypothetical protein LY78DRAFT_22674 [Colletotrichum sublineola]
MTTQPLDSSKAQSIDFPRTFPHVGIASMLFLSVDMPIIPGQPLMHPCSTLFPHDFPAKIPPKSLRTGQQDQYSRITKRSSTNRPCLMMTNPLPRTIGMEPTPRVPHTLQLTSLPKCSLSCPR